MDSSEYRSRYGIAKLQDHNYHTWSFQCQMLLSENKVWDVVVGKSIRPADLADLPETDPVMSATARKAAEKAVTEWDDKNEVTLRIISFTVIDRFQSTIRNGKTAKGAWEELQKVLVPRDKQRKYSLIRRLYRLDMQSGSSLRDHEETFDSLVQSLSAIGKEYEDEELIILFANSLPPDVFGNWIQTQMAFIDGMSLTDFKGRV